MKIFISFFKKHPFPIDKYQCDVYNSIDDSQCEVLIMEREECTKILKALADDTRMKISEYYATYAFPSYEDTLRLRNCYCRERLEMDALFH